VREALQSIGVALAGVVFGMLLLSALAHAEDLPAEPAKHAPLEGECIETATVIGRVPGVIGADGKATCRGVVVPTSRLADLLDTEAAYKDLRAWTRIEMVSRDTLLAASQRDTEWWKHEATKPVPVTARPWFNYTLGVASVLGGAWAISQVNEAP
jgi:hypothetical protein